MVENTERRERERVRKLASRRGFKLTAVSDAASPSRYLLNEIGSGASMPFANLADVAAELYARQDMQAA
jgi:hypothetical protein